jgi:hypothetical protein
MHNMPEADSTGAVGEPRQADKGLILCLFEDYGRQPGHGSLPTILISHVDYSSRRNHAINNGRLREFSS